MSEQPENPGITYEPTQPYEKYQYPVLVAALDLHMYCRRTKPRSVEEARKLAAWLKWRTSYEIWDRVDMYGKSGPVDQLILTLVKAILIEHRQDDQT